MNKSIKCMEICIDDSVKRLDFSDRNVIDLRDEYDIKSDTILFTLERFLALDFGSFYDDIDSNLGVKYDNIDIGTSSLSYSEGSVYFTDGRLTSVGEIPRIHCIRYVNGNLIRSFLVSDNEVCDEIDIDMTHFNSCVPDSKWQRIEVLVNSIVGYPFIDVDLKCRCINFDFESGLSKWSRESLEVIYLLVSESMLTPDGYTRVILLSEIESLSNDRLLKLVDTLGDIDRNELILFS